MSKPSMPKCPVCGTNKNVEPNGCVGDVYRCTRCRGVFDIAPEEGGDFHTDPSRRMHLAEQAEIRRRERAQRGRR